MKKITMLLVLLGAILNGFGQNSKTDNDNIWDPYPPGQTSEYKATALNTNFTIPLVRFNRTSGDNTRAGNVSLFNSIGAGYGISWGRMEVTTDEAGKVINTEMNNTFGIHLGVLFAANTNNGNPENVFAPTLSVSLLNFQIGYGLELGTLAANQKRGFVTIAYNIPISKLVKGGFYLIKRSEHRIDYKQSNSAAPGAPKSTNDSATPASNQNRFMPQ